MAPKSQSESRKASNNTLYAMAMALGQPNGWTFEGQLFNFHHLTRGLSLKNAEVLDVGCGTGELYDFLQSDIRNYKGIDIFEPSIILASERNRQFFEVADILEFPLTRIYDWVFSSGAISTCPDYKAFIGKLNEHALHGFAFNFLDEDSQDKDPVLNYFNSDHILEACSNYRYSITEQYVTIDGMNFKQCTVQVYKTLDAIPKSL